MAAYPFTFALAALAAALAPAFVIRGHIRTFPTTALEVAILCTLAAFAIESVWRRLKPEWRTPLTLPAAVFLVAGAISVLAAPSSNAALGLYRAYFIEPVLMALVLVTVVRTRRQAYLLLLGFCIGATVLAVANSAVVLREILNHSFNPRLAPPTAIYPVGNQVALYLVPLVGLGAGIALAEGDRVQRLLFGLFAAIAATASVLAFSRGGWLGLFAVAVGLALATRRRRLWLGGIAATMVGLALVPAISHRVTDFFLSSQGRTLDGRTPLWGESVNMLAAHPLFGAGLSGFVQRVAETDGVRVYVIDPHNIVLNFWSETGLLGLAAFAAIFILLVRLNWRGSRNSNSEWRPLRLGLLLALLAIFVHGLVDVPYFKNDLSFEFWALAALTLVATRTRTGVAARPPTSRRTSG
jgi:putative inorganic carbon (hco3(-)) transporter